MAETGATPPQNSVLHRFSSGWYIVCMSISIFLVEMSGYSVIVVLEIHDYSIKKYKDKGLQRIKSDIKFS